MTWYDFTWYELFPQIINMSMTASIIILAVLCVRLFLKNAPKIFSYALWAVVLFRLLCPVSFTLDISLLNTFDVPVTESGSIEYVPVDIVHMAEPSVNTLIPVVNEVINDSLPQGREQLVADPLEFPVSFATYIWLCGIAAMIIYSVMQYMKLRRRLVGEMPLRDNIYLADHIDSPFVMGLLFPKIYLPSSLSTTEQEYIIFHEKHHIRRGDHIVKIMAFIALCIHWFNPLVWLAFALSSKDMEMSCDEAVMRKMDHDIRAEYATSLLRFATDRKILVGTPLAFGEGDTKARVKNVMKYKKPLLLVSAIAGAVILVITIFFMANPVYKNTELFGANYEVKQVLYDTVVHSVSDEFVSQEMNELTYCITADYGLYVRYEEREGWNYLGSMRSCALDKDTFMECTTDEGWQISYNIKDITDAYYLWHNSRNKLYLALQTKSGDTLLCYGQMKEFPDDAGRREIDHFDYILQLESTFYENYTQTNFFMRTLEHAANTNVDTFAFWQSDYMPGYMIVGFAADDLVQKQQDMRDMGFAVFQSNNGTGYKLLDYHIYKDAALIENGIYFASGPAVCDLNGVITDDTAFDVILSTRDSKLASIVRVLDDGTELKRSVTENTFNMTLFHWADQADSKSVKQYYYDADGNIIEDTGVIILPEEPASEVQDATTEASGITVSSQGKGILGATKSLDLKDAYYMINLLDNADWQEETADCINDCVIVLEEGVSLYYHSDCGTFNDNVQNRCLVLSEEEHETLNNILAKYITLGSVEVPSND